MARWISRFSSGTSDSAMTFHPYSCAAVLSAGPPRSSYRPFEARSEIVMIPAEICIWLSLPLGLRHQLHTSYLHFLIHCLAHIINREGGNAYRSERFHFNAGLRGDFCR